MKSYLFILMVISIPSCVSSKKYKLLEMSVSQTKIDLELSNNLVSEYAKNNLETEQKLLSAQHEIQMKDQKAESVKKEQFLKDQTIQNLESNLDFVKSTNIEISKRMDDLSAAAKVNVDIMKKLLEDSEVQQLKVLNLSLALQKQDSLNIHLVKRTKKNISDQKLKKSLEKLGFVFY